MGFKATEGSNGGALTSAPSRRAGARWRADAAGKRSAHACHPSSSLHGCCGASKERWAAASSLHGWRLHATGRRQACPPAERPGCSALRGVGGDPQRLFGQLVRHEGDGYTRDDLRWSGLRAGGKTYGYGRVSTLTEQTLGYVKAGWPMRGIGRGMHPGRWDGSERPGNICRHLCVPSHQPVAGGSSLPLPWPLPLLCCSPCCSLTL